MAASIVQTQPISSGCLGKRRRSFDSSWNAIKIGPKHKRHHVELPVAIRTARDMSTDVSEGIAAALAAGTSNLGREHLETIEAPYNYLSSKSGQNFRRKLLDTCNVWLQVDSAFLDTIDKIVTILHTSALLIDDIQDSSLLRRGAPSAHLVFGVAQTINAFNYMYFRAQELLRDLPQPERAFCIFTEELLHLHEGQGMELYWRDRLTPSTVEQYFQMVSNKTGGLFRLLGRLMMLCSPKDIDVLPILNILGVWYQVRDDYCNLASDKMRETKGFVEDLTEGKFSLPILHAAGQSSTRDSIVWRVLRIKTEDPKIKAKAVDHMRDATGSLTYTRKIAEALGDETEQHLARLPPNLAMSAIIKKLRPLD